MYIFFLFFKAIAWLISLLPFCVLYIISDFLFVIFYYIAKYRKSVVFENLRNAFPEKNPEEINKIAKKYFHNLCDIIIEVIKIRHITPNQLLKRVEFKNYQILDDLYASGKSVIAATGHCGNWEWMSMNMSYITKFNGYVIVKPLSNKYFDEYLNKLRTKFAKGGGVIRFKETYRKLIQLKNVQTLSGFAADQTPAKNEITYWTKFLNQNTPVYLGVEKIAKSLEMAVVFIYVKRIKRGFYEAEIIKITDDARLTVGHEITEKHVQLLDQFINKYPDNWLWSHKRWKYKPVGVQK